MAIGSEYCSLDDANKQRNVVDLFSHTTRANHVGLSIVAFSESNSVVQLYYLYAHPEIYNLNTGTCFTCVFEQEKHLTVTYLFSNPHL